MAVGEAAHRLVIYDELIGSPVFIGVHSRGFAVELNCYDLAAMPVLKSAPISVHQRFLLSESGLHGIRLAEAVSARLRPADEFFLSSWIV